MRPRSLLAVLVLSAPALAQHHEEPAAPANPPAKEQAPAAAQPAPAQPAAAPVPKPEPTKPISADEALKRLQEGNQRWTSGRPMNPRTDPPRMKAQAEGQTPFAAILTCADSRIPVERVFDQGVGDIFDVRVAGNIAGDHETGSLEYGAEHLKIPLLIVMGHTKCGAVSAAATNAKVEGNIPSLISAIEPSVARARAANPGAKPAELVPVAIRENVWQSIFTILKTSPTCRERIAAGELKIVGAVYNVADGTVEWMGEHPWQSELITAFTNPATKPLAEHPADDHR